MAQLLDDCFGLHTKDQLALLRWKYAQPHTALIAYGAFDEDKLVSFYSNREYHIQQGTRNLKAAICLDMATLPAYRGQGLIRELSQRVYKEVEKEQFELSFGFSNADGVQVDRNSKNYGYTVVGQFKTFYSYVGWRTPTTLQWRVVEQFVELNHKLPKTYVLNQDPITLQWRYQQKPETPYIVLDILDKDEVVTQAVLKRGKSSVTLFKLVWNDKLEDSEFSRQVISAIKDYVGQHSKLISIMVIENEFWKKVLQGGWWPKLNQSPFFLTVKPHSALSVSKKDILNVNRWRVMGGDLL